MGDLRQIALALLALPCATLHAADTPGTITGCRTLREDAARLACYDRLPDPAAQHSATPPAPAASAAATVTQAPALTVEQRFGTTELQQARTEAAKAPPKEELRELRAKVARIQPMGQGGLRVTLANGQVWYQLVPSEKIYVSLGEEVVIKAAAFGSFLLVDHDRHSARVHRAE